MGYLNQENTAKDLGFRADMEIQDQLLSAAQRQNVLGGPIQEVNMSAAKMLSLSRQQELRAIPTCVADVMTRNVVTLTPNQTFANAVSLMASKSFRHFLVVHPDGRLAGVISDRDIFRAMGRVTNWQAKTVNEVMSHDPYTVKPQTPLSVAVGEVLSRRINCLPVVDDNGKVCGILTSTDLLSVYQKLQACFDKMLGELQFAER